MLRGLLLVVVLGACGGEAAPSPPACTGEAEVECVTACGTAGVRVRLPSCELGDCTPLGELCNGSDDDCDERADEALGCALGASETCETACGTTGRRSCGEGCVWSECTPPVEVCGNGQDDDCDGVIDGEAAVLAEHAYETGPRPVSLASDASGLWVVLLDADALTGIHRLGADGTIGEALRTDRRPITPSTTSPLLCVEDGRAAMLWPHALTHHVLVAGVDGAPSTAELSPPGFISAQAVDLSWVGPRLAVAYARAVGGGVTRIFLQRLTARARPLEGEVPVSSGRGVAEGPSLAVAPPFRTHLVAWSDDRSNEIDIALFGPELQPLRGELPLTATPEGERASQPDVATDGEGFLVAWVQGTEVERHVFVASVDADGNAGAPHRLSVGHVDASRPRIVWTGAEHWVVWKDESANGRVQRMMAARVHEGVRRGRILEVTGRAGWIGNAPEVAWHDGRLFVLWSEIGGPTHLATIGCE